MCALLYRGGLCARKTPTDRKPQLCRPLDAAVDVQSGLFSIVHTGTWMLASECHWCDVQAQRVSRWRTCGCSWFATMSQILSCTRARLDVVFVRARVCVCVFVFVSTSVSVSDSVFTRSGSVQNCATATSAHYVPLKDLCPVAERTVAAVYLAIATLRSFRHSCSGRPLSLPAALLIARLDPAS